MKRVLLMLFLLLSLNLSGQSKAEIINSSILSIKKYVGQTDPNGMIITDAINENNTTLVYIYKAPSKELADFYKTSQSNQSLIDMSPNSLSKQAKKNGIIIKWRYYYNNKIYSENIIYPNEWNEE